MTAGTTTQRFEERVSLPRTALGALLVATLVTGGLLGAAIHAEIGVAITQPSTLGVTLAPESTVVRDLRIAAGRGQLIAEAGPAPTTGPTTTTVVITHAPGHGPLR